LFLSLSLQDAAIAAQFLTGRAFPQYEERVIGVGGASLVRVVAEAGGRSQEDLIKIYRKHGDLGDVAEEILSNSNKRSDFALLDLKNLFDKLATARTQFEKDQLLQQAFTRASAAEVKYIVKILTGDLRIGSKESLVEEAIAAAFGRDIADVRRANLLMGDIGETLRMAAEDRLNAATVRLFHSLGFMLATPVETASEIFEGSQSTAVYIEQKFDGIRAQVHKDAASKVKMFSRNAMK